MAPPRVIQPERTGSPAPLRGGELGGLSFARKAYAPDEQCIQERRGMDIGRIEAVEAELNWFIERRARGAKSGRELANEEAARQRAADARRGAAARLVNATAWSAYYGGLALRHHDLAAENARKRDEYAALVRQLQETNDKGGTAA